MSKKDKKSHKTLTNSRINELNHHTGLRKQVHRLNQLFKFFDIILGYWNRKIDLVKKQGISLRISAHLLYVVDINNIGTVAFEYEIEITQSFFGLFQ